MIRRIRTWFASRRLAKLVERQRQSFACQDYRRRRYAALKHTRPTQADYHAGAA